MIFLAAAAVFLIAAVFLLWKAGQMRRSTGIPSGRVVYSDTGAWKKIERPLYHEMTHLTGRPDYLVEHRGIQIPIEVKSGYAPALPYEGHLYQLAAYCLLVEKNYNQRPPFGLIHYRNRTLSVDYTADLEEALLDLLTDMRQQERREEIDRSHADPARCARCGYRSTCDQRL
jgi:CRISPR-associated exonuclease Cas4